MDSKPTTAPTNTSGFSSDKNHFLGKSVSPAGETMLTLTPERVRGMATSASFLPGVLQGAQADAVLENARRRMAQVAAQRTNEAPKPVSSRDLTRGTVCLHSPSGKTFTIIKACAALTPSGKPMHEVIDNETGERMTLRASNLKPL